ncbi:MAG: superoxide dismutase [Armatimonadetes bacterium]|nr:superoxide dismutase [Armatimonadota bacterium]
MSDSVSRRELLSAAMAAPFLGGISGLALGADAGMENYAAFANGKYVLPPLPYPYNALEPHIDEATMRLHHDKHHLGYVNGLNKALDELAEARRTGDFNLVKHWERELAFHGSGHFLHTLFWLNMGPKGGGTPTGSLAKAISRDFGSFKAFMAHFSAASKQVEASGWGILAYEPIARKLLVSQAEKHQNLTEWGVIPLLVLDVWEHAYYLKYQNDRGKYVDNWWNVVNWPFVQRRFEILEDIVLQYERRMNEGARRR